MTVISLTSIPPRFGGLGPVLESLLDQGAEAVVLALPRRFRRFEGQFKPPPLPHGVELLAAEDDLGPATKFVTPQRALADTPIAICDDDCLYAPGWLRALSALSDGQNAVAGSVFDLARLKRKGGSVVQGFAGVLLPAGLDLPPPPEACLWADDLWLSAQLQYAGVTISPCPAARALVTPLSAPAPLQDDRRAETYARAAQEISTRLGIWPALRDKA